MSTSQKDKLTNEIKKKFLSFALAEKNKAEKQILVKLKAKLTDFSQNWDLQYGELPIIGLYIPLKQEINVLEVIDWNLGRVSLPTCKNKDEAIMEFALFKESKAEVPPAGYFWDVKDPTYCIPDLILVPGLGFDKNGYRLGRGKGYYDLYFAQHECMSIGLCYSWQMIDMVETMDHDKKMKMILTEKEIFEVNRCDFL